MVIMQIQAVIILMALKTISGKTYEETLEETIDKLWDNIDRVFDRFLQVEELEVYFSRWGSGSPGWKLYRKDFVEGWTAEYGQDESQAAAFFRSFDWIAQDEDCYIDALDVQVFVERLGIYGTISEEAFKAYQKVYYQGNFVAALYDDYDNGKIGDNANKYDTNFITSDDWFDKLGADIRGSDSVASLSEWRTFFTRKYCTQVSADKFFYDVNGDGVVDEDEWTSLYLFLKSLYDYPELEQLHLEEFMKWEEAALGTPRPLTGPLESDN